MQFRVEIFSLKKSAPIITGSFALSGHQQKLFTIQLDGNREPQVQEGLPMGSNTVYWCNKRNGTDPNFNKGNY